MTLRKRKILLFVSIAAFMAITPAILLYTDGYRIGDDFKITKTGGLYISSPLPGSDIFLDNKKIKQTNIIQGGVFVQNLSPDSYSVLVAKEGFWPWAKTLDVKEQFVTEARAFLLPENPTGEVILKGVFSSIWASPFNNILLLEEKKTNSKRITFYLPKEKLFLTDSSSLTTQLLSFKNDLGDMFWQKDGVVLELDGQRIKADFDLSKNTASAGKILPSEFRPEENSPYFFENESLAAKYVRVTASENQRIWWGPGTNEVWAEWLNNSPLPYYFKDKKALIIKTRSPIKNIDFLPQRRDIVVLGVENGVFAIEIDERGGRILQPIYKGGSPTFAAFHNEKIIYVLDEGNLIKIEI